MNAILDFLLFMLIAGMRFTAICILIFVSAVAIRLTHDTINRKKDNK